MDRNTLTGLVLIGLLLTVFTIINKPSEEELKAQQEKVEKEKLAQSKAKDTLEVRSPQRDVVDTLVSDSKIKQNLTSSVKDSVFIR